MSCSSNQTSKTREKLYDFMQKNKDLSEDCERLKDKFSKLSEKYKRMETSFESFKEIKIENEKEFYNIIDELQMKNRELQKELDEKDKILDSVRGLVN